MFSRSRVPKAKREVTLYDACARRSLPVSSRVIADLAERKRPVVETRANNAWCLVAAAADDAGRFHEMKMLIDRPRSVREIIAEGISAIYYLKVHTTWHASVFKAGARARPDDAHG